MRHRHCEATLQMVPKQSQRLLRLRLPAGRQARNDSVILVLFFLLSISTNSFVFANTSTKIRAAHFSTVTHAPALIARARGHFEGKFKDKAAVEWKIFNAGPEAIEALFANAIDILYVGPNPAVNGFVRSEGKALRIVAGVASGGSSFVVRPETGIRKFEDISGKRVSAPQVGNSQDVALRHLMKEKGLTTKDQGGDVELFHMAGGDQLTAMVKGEVDAIWTVEPWVSRLESEANGKILFDEKGLWPDGRHATAVLAVRKKFMEEHPDWVKQWVRAHAEMIDWMNQNREEAKQLFNEELKRETGKAIAETYLNRSFERVLFTFDPMESSVLTSAGHAEEIGFLGRKKVDLNGLYDLSFLNADQTSGERS